MGRASARALAAAEVLDAASLDALDADGRRAVETLQARGYYRLQPAARTRR
jgi:hypothetical protein